MFTTAFWKAAFERAIKSAAQVAILTIGADTFNVVGLDWAEVGGFAGGGLVLSLLTSVAFGAKDGNPSATNAEVTKPESGAHRDDDGDGIADGLVQHRGQNVDPGDGPDVGKTGRGGYATGQ